MACAMPATAKAIPAKIEPPEFLQLFVFTQFPRESATRFSRQNRYAVLLELL
ncbi:MAG: hypothetical protein J0J15_10950 [Mesorhizobium sp.]|nr:hypothetical protein [Mesorhizobium sp.]